MIYSVIFAEGGLGSLDGLVTLFIQISLGFGASVTLLAFLINLISKQKLKPIIYILVFLIASILPLIISGVVCGLILIDY